MIVLAIAVLAGLCAMTYYGYRMMLDDKEHHNGGHSTGTLEDVMQSAPAVRIDVIDGKMETTDSGVTYLNGAASVSVLDDDAHTTESFDVKFERFDIPVPTGMAAAAEVDGLKSAMVYIIRGAVDSVDFEFTSGARAATQSL